MKFNQAKQIMKKYWPNESMSSDQLKLILKKFKTQSPKKFKNLAKASQIILNQSMKTVKKNPVPTGLVKVGKFGSKILARRAGAAGLSFGAGPVAGAAMTTAGVILTGKDLYNYYKMLKQQKATKKTVKKNPVKKVTKKMVKIKVNRPIGYRIADIGKGGKEYNVIASRHWKK